MALALIGLGLVILNFKTSFGPIKLVQVVTPVEPLIQKVVHRIYCPVYLSLKWYKQFYSANSIQFSNRKEIMDW
ncbi:cholesterol 7-desaturase nvd-like [Metopolophium dirhodum]|uniref:cholesterol 7-desaturase nvd-like n=1 Tax=Metopolophium dirhodum TaxID=44670 RepID=UPI00299020D4|nr:cholesterol 7-desaturase nvd-like [Metopolophium dirhodum]